MIYTVDPDITVASTIDAAFYRDEAAFTLARSRIFGRSWQWIGDLEDVAEPAALSPRTLLDGVLDEPLLLARDASGTLRCLSNVCTHRGNILVREPRSHASDIRCGYHSRRFDLSGRMTFMPEFSLAKNFPSPADHLATVPFAAWMNHGFAAIDPLAPLEAFLGDIASRVASVPVDRFRLDPASTRDYVVQAHWALYVENYLEGLHIPFVHPGLSQSVDYASYADELFRYAIMQTAFARNDEAAFDPATIDAGGRGRITACYAWIFPNLMLNFYPWGLSVNRVVPEAIDRTRVEFRAYVGDEAKRGQGAGGALHDVEMEDEAVVEAVQRGVRSSFYRAGRYSPTRERGTHHFHRLLCEFMREP
jgi:choline monooxygenase